MSVDALLTYARSQIGYVEKPTNRTKYGRQFGADGVFWCMQFVWACFENSGNHGLVPKTASTRDLYARAQAGHLGMEWRKATAPPRPGDLVEYFMGGKLKPVNHIGIVEAVSGGRIICIEGNTGGRGPDGERNGGMVARKNRDLSKVVNFVRPQFPGGAAPAGHAVGARPGPPPYGGQVIKRGSTDKPAVRQVQARLNTIYKGRIAACDGKPLPATGGFGDRTEKTVRAFQQLRGLKVDGEVGRKTWTALFG
jgi:hypothetical protein